MKAARLLLPVALLGGCGDGEPVANQTQPVPAKAIAVPIDKGGVVHEAMTAAPPPPTAVLPKPLVSRGTSSPRPAAPAYRAIGTEPFWAVTVRGSTATLERPGHAPQRFSVRTEADDKAIRYQGDGFAMTLTQGPCSDGMSDAIWSDRVQVAFGEGTLKGCGGERDGGERDGGERDGGDDAP
ncbi:membrane-like protein [Sphingomonas sp. VDB2]|uniref:membrane-like protein n=1 Tax=Sphingomonas sp. VDB2 TaxID=3228751 RepID=UPI003A7FF9FE